MIERLKKTVELDPSDLDGWINLGDAYYDSDNYDDAIEAYREAAMNPSIDLPAIRNVSAVFLTPW